MKLEIAIAQKNPEKKIQQLIAKSTSDLQHAS
jgi:hypothetical protein